jgi:hypothetical protein
MSARLFYSGPSLKTLHEDYAKKGRIDDHGSIRTSYETVIEATVGEVWDILGDPQHWALALPAIHAVHLTSGVQDDAPFTWKNGSASMTSRFAVVRPGQELTWTGSSMGFKAIHQHLLTEIDGGRVRLRVNESMSGPLLPLFFSTGKLHAALSAWIDGIKQAAEQAHNRAPGPAARAADGRPAA